MSLEASIAELTLAVRALTDVLLNPVQPQVISTPVGSLTVEEATKVVIEQIVDQAAHDEYAALTEAQKEAAEVREELTYDDVKKATIALSAKSKAEAVELLAHFGVKKATELPQDQWHIFVEMATLAVSA